MNRKGSILLEAILGLCFIGIISTYMLPLLCFSFNNVKSIRYMDEMSYIGEMVVEKIRSKSGSIDDVISSIILTGEIDYIDSAFDEDKYSVKIVKDKESAEILEYSVIVKAKGGESGKEIIYKSSIRK